MIVLKQLNIEVILQFGDNASVSIFLACEVEALYLVGISIRVKFLKTPQGTEAEFFASTTLDALVGKLKVSLTAKAAVGDYLNSQDSESTRALATLDDKETRALSSGNLLDADWDLQFQCDWETAQWLKDLGAAIVEGLKIIGAAIAFVWNEITEFVSVAWDAIKDLAAEIGGAIAGLFLEMGKLVDGAKYFVAEGVDAAAIFLRGEAGALGDFAADALQFAGEVAGFAFDRFGDALDLVCMFAL